MNETWKDIAGYEGLYQVSDLGRVKSLRRVVECKNRWGGTHARVFEEMIMKPVVCNKRWSRHVKVHLTSNGIPRPFLVHRLVLSAFVGPCPDGMEGCHDPDPDPANNALSNLRWDTHANNNRDKAKHGTQSRGEMVKNSVLTEDKVRFIRATYSKGQITVADIANDLGLKRGVVQAVVLRQNWAWVT